VKEAKTPSAAVTGQPLKHAIKNRQPPRDDRCEREYDDADNRPAGWFRRSVVSVVPRDWDVIVDSAATDKGLNGRDDTAATVALRKMAEHHGSHKRAPTRDLFVCDTRAAAADREPAFVTKSSERHGLVVAGVHHSRGSVHFVQVRFCVARCMVRDALCPRRSEHILSWRPCYAAWAC
jgi:hypothetical protein